MSSVLAIIGAVVLLSLAEERLPKLIGDLLFGALLFYGALCLLNYAF